MKRLIVNADDFGISVGVNRAIVELNSIHNGLPGPLGLSSTTLMAGAAATGDAVALALRNPGLSVGVHIVLVDGSPVLPREQLPTLTDPATGQFRRSLGRFVRDLTWGRIDGAEIEVEAAAQIARLQSLGLPLTHIDTHKHTHIFPRVLAPLLKAAKVEGIRAIRNPFEAAWSLAATRNAPWLRRAQVRILNSYRPTFLRLVAQAGIATTDGAVGVLATGTLSASVLRALLRAMPEGTWELVTHPGYFDLDLANAGTRLLASRELEREALSVVGCDPGILRINFTQLVEPLGPPA